MDSLGLSHIISRFANYTFLEEKCLEETVIFISLFTEHEKRSTYCEIVNLCISNYVFAKAIM